EVNGAGPRSLHTSSAQTGPLENCRRALPGSWMDDVRKDVHVRERDEIYRMASSSALGDLSDCCCRRAVGGVEGLQGQLRECDVDRGSEDGRRAEEGQDTSFHDELQRDSDPRVLGPGHGASSFDTPRLGVAAQLFREVGEDGVGRELDLAADSLEQMRPPFTEVRNPRCQTGWMQCQA